MLKRVIQLKKELDALRPISQAQEQRIMQKFRLGWNYHSNHLEGNTLTFGETKALILFGLTAQGKPFQDHIEMSGHDEAVKWIEEVVKQERPLNEAFIRELHTLILKESSEKKSQTTDGKIVTRRIEVGKYKTQPNHVLTKTGEMFYFATPEETPAKMNDLMNWYSEERKKEETNPVLLATEFHYRFIRIHPFDDGNGRTARLLMNFILMSYGYPPVIIKTTDKQQYFNVLQLADAGNIEPFILYIAENLVHSLEIMIKGAKGENIDEDDDLMKEIALLEVDLRNLGSSKKLIKSYELVNDIWENFITPFFKKLLYYNEAFAKYYVSYTTNIQYLSYGSYVDKDDFPSLTQILHERDRDTRDFDTIGINEFRFSCYFNIFRYSKFSEFGYSDDFTILFHATEYKIRYDRKDIISRSYDEQPSHEEYDNFLKTIINKHKEVIQEYIKEKRNSDDLTKAIENIINEKT